MFKRLREWFSRLPPLMPPSVTFPAQTTPNEPEHGQDLVVLSLPTGVLGWLVAHLPFGETVSREEAAATLLQRDIQVRYRPMIIEVDKIPLDR